MVGLFDRFKKNDEDELEGGMVEERESEPEESAKYEPAEEPKPEESATEYEPAEKSEPVVETPSPQMMISSSGSF